MSREKKYLILDSKFFGEDYLKTQIDEEIERKRYTIFSDYDEVGSFREGIALAHNGRGYGYIDIEGNAVVPYGKYIKTFSFSEGMGLVLNENGWGYVSYLVL